jgi:hypothetical protein
MNTSSSITRRLYDWEIEEARLVFGASLRYHSVVVHEGADWTNWLDRIGRFLKGMPPTNTNNAVTIGNHCFFPIRLTQRLPDLDEPDFYQIGWLIHELTHAWQYQRLGWGYLIKAISAQFKGQAGAYEFGGADGLMQSRQGGWSLTQFNLEQQGEIARTYYERLRRQEDLTHWQPFVAELQDTPTREVA